MEDPFRLPLAVVLTLNIFLAIGCASTGSDDGAVAPSPDIGSPNTPDQGAPEAGDIGSDRGENLGKDVTNTIETVKGRDLSLPQRGVFFSLGVQDLERTADAGDERTGSASDITNVSIGYDQFVSASLVLGSLLDVSRRETQSESDVDDVSLSSDALTLLFFGNLVLNEAFDVSAYIGIGRADTDSSRNTRGGSIAIQDQGTDRIQTVQVQPGETRGEALSRIYSGGVFASHRTVFGTGNQFTVSAEADFYRIATDAFSEQGSTNSELAYRDNRRDTIRGTLSAGVSRTYSSSLGVLVPGITLSYINEVVDDDAIIADVISDPDLTTAIDAEPSDRDYGAIDLDLVWVRPRGLQFFGNLKSTFANRFEDATGLNVGARLEF